MILGLVEREGDGAGPSELSLQALTLGRRLAEEVGDRLEAVLIGEQARPIAGALGAYGASTVHLVETEGLGEYAPEAWAGSVVQLIDTTRPDVVVAAGTERGQEVMAHVAARLGLPLAANCTEVHPGDPFRVSRQRWGGTLLEDAELAGTIKLLTVAPHAARANASNDPGVAEVVSFVPELTDEDFRVRVTERVDRVAGAVALTEARVVVGGGRGVGGPDGFRALEELAELLGGAVGCSRAVTSAGWRPHADQIGQTGVRIAPDLYIACGISGATQHIVGCKGAKHIMVVNTDPEAPILARADYAVIGDVRQVIPAVNAEIRKAVKP
jgi:electron transfer flavoprotein alpha subunit